MASFGDASHTRPKKLFGILRKFARGFIAFSSESLERKHNVPNGSPFALDAPRCFFC